MRQSIFHFYFASASHADDRELLAVLLYKMSLELVFLELLAAITPKWALDLDLLALLKQVLQILIVSETFLWLDATILALSEKHFVAKVLLLLPT